MKKLRLLLPLIFASSVVAQDQEPFPFEDFPDFDASADAESGAAQDTPSDLPVEEAVSSAKAPPPQKASEEEKSETTAVEEAPPVEDAELAETEAPTPAENESPDQLTVTSPSAPSPLLSQPTNTEDFGEGQESLMSSGSEVPEDVRELEKRLQSAEQQVGEQRARDASSGEPGSELAPSDKFARVPLRPPMSDANWVRWAGPMAQKDYKIRRGDSLWAVSERLFGNPYLWPKIWHLNARITNPHIIEKGMTLSFSPGNPGSAPELAFRPDADDVNSTTIHPLTKLDKKRTLLEMIDETLRLQISQSHPPFQHFMLDRKPAVLGRMPPALERSGRTYFVEGDQFRLNLGDGIFPIVKVVPVTERFVRGFRVRWIGLVKVRDRQAEIIKAFTEIASGDEIVQRRFQLSPLAVHKDSVGPEYRAETTLVKLEEAAQTHAGPGQLMGVLFPGVGLGPRPGALLDVQVGTNKKVQALLVDRDQRFGTLWIVSGDQEVSLGDQIF